MYIVTGLAQVVSEGQEPGRLTLRMVEEQYLSHPLSPPPVVRSSGSPVLR
jgi:hypothetical protein